MLRAARLVIEFARGVDETEFRTDLKTQSAVLHQLLVLGEAVKRLSAPYRAQHPARPIAGMRDRLIHGYDAVDLAASADDQRGYTATGGPGRGGAARGPAGAAMSGGARDASDANAFARLRAEPGVPQRLDLPVLAARDEAWSRRGRLALRLTTDGGGPIGRAYVFNGEWFPGRDHGVAFAHYFPALERAFEGLEQGGRPNRLRLQVLKAVAAETSTGGQIIVLLKFIIAPEWTLTGGQLEVAYGCPLALFYTGFVGVGRDPLRDATSPGFTVGNAIHAGYRHAATAFVEGGDEAAASGAYLGAVARSWADDFANLLLDRPKGRPKELHKRPVAARETVLARLRASWSPRAEEAGRGALLQERLFFAPGRGISGRADRIVYREDAGDAAGAGSIAALYEIKTGGGFGAEKDPANGVARPGGLQALAYREIVRALGAGEPETFIEAIEGDEATIVPLADHPIVRRARADLRRGGDDDRALDLLAQNRNIGFLAVSGLLTGYDRFRIDAIAGLGRRLRGVGGDWSLHASATPCAICAVGARGLCEAARAPSRPPVAHFFRHLPQELYAYWVWFHRQLQEEERAGREALYHLATTPPAILEGQEGISVGGLRIADCGLRNTPPWPPAPGGSNGGGREKRPAGPGGRGGASVTFERAARIETRLREDDRVLVTPGGRAPGELFSVEGTLRAVGAQAVTVELRDTLPPSADGEYRIDQLPFLSSWQVQGLTDFLIGAVNYAAAGGRQLATAELPRLARIILGAEEPAPAAGELADVGAGRLNEDQRRAIGAALALPPGEILLIQGPPGTGKTTMVAELARELAARGFFALADDPGRRPLVILANTHRAADEVARKLGQLYPDLRPYLVRVGTARAATEPEVRAQILGERLRVRETLEGLDLDDPAGLERWVRLIRAGNLLHDHAQIFVGTLAAANAPELRGLAFETVIVDETGQATEPAALQALRHLPPGYAGRLILVGDHQQLPPVVPEASGALPLPPPPESLRAAGHGEGGLKVSLFERLARRHPRALLTLAAQYRMNGPICALVSELFYDGALRPADARTAEARLSGFVGRGPWAVGREGTGNDWAAAWGDEPIVFLDTSRDPAARDTVRHWSADESRDNPREAVIVAALLAGLFRGVPRDHWPALAAEVGVISAYRKQNNRLRAEIAAREPALAALPALRIDTVDRFQGGERQILVVSLVNSNDGHVIGSLHADPRRLNVAISRAKTKLILVGDRDTFTGPGREEEEGAKKVYRRLFALLDRQAATGEALVIGTAGLT